jgi:tRNA threonylcarbamoyl adenosine modification protein YeaZ
LQDFVQPQTWQDLAFLAVAKGPGGFTGTRIGVVTARTLAQQLDLSLFAVSSLAAVAWAERSRLLAVGSSPNSELDIAVQMQAQRGDLFTAIYGIRTASMPEVAHRDLLPLPATVEKNAEELIVLLPDTVMAPTLWQQILDTWQNPYHLVQAEDALGSTANSVLELAYLDWKQGVKPHWSAAQPFYGQHCVVESR